MELDLVLAFLAAVIVFPSVALVVSSLSDLALAGLRTYRIARLTRSRAAA